jgi:hypothetical protein
MNFKYQIGDSVMRTDDIKAMLYEMEHTEQIPHCTSMRILERVSTECVGGVQRYYICENWQGLLPRFAEDSLMPSREAWDQWRDALRAQDARVKAKKEQL